MLKLYPHLISHFHTFHFQQAAKLSKMSVRRDEISSMKRKNAINGQRVGCLGLTSLLSVSICICISNFNFISPRPPPLPLYLALPQFDSLLCRRFTFKWTRGSFFFPLLSLSPANWKFPIALNLKVMPISQMALGKSWQNFHSFSTRISLLIYDHECPQILFVIDFLLILAAQKLKPAHHCCKNMSRAINSKDSSTSMSRHNRWWAQPRLAIINDEALEENYNRTVGNNNIYICLI